MTLVLSGSALLVWSWWYCLPSPLFPAPRSTHLLASDGSLLGARIAADGQWRMAPSAAISDRLRTAVVAFEDRRFYRHNGLDLRAVVRAARDNLRAGRTVSGGSTLTMQVARLAGGHGRRSVWNKLRETIYATRLEAGHSKREILDLWLNNAPFGGNVVGIEAACYRYYGRGAASLSWAEAATLAVLPNAPGLLRPGKNADRLRAKRDRLLDYLAEQGHLSSSALGLAKLESLPTAPLTVPQIAPRLLNRRIREDGSGRYATSIRRDLQDATASLLLDHHRRLRGNQIFNLALRVSEVGSGKTIVYHGNVPGGAATRASQVDLITAARSPGSLLKPMLYASALADGSLLPTTLLPDIPTRFAGFRPSNFHDRYDGAVAANEALVRSLNIPFVHLLRNYGYARFHRYLQGVGFAHMDRGADTYGLSLILGGAEITQEEIHDWFLAAARRLVHYDSLHQRGEPTDLNGIDAGSLYLTFNQLRDLSRPAATGTYRQFASHTPIAWKTGTSFGYRDAWAVGATPDHVISVWVGNATGEGRPGIVGIEAAAPVLFGVLRILETEAKNKTWFPVPYDEVSRLPVCARSGQLATRDCPAVSVEVPLSGRTSSPCAYHRLITVDAANRVRTTQRCDPQARQRSAFVLPATQAHYYASRHPEYRRLPPYDPNCPETANLAPADIRLLYPEGSGALSVALNWKGEKEPFFFEVVHSDPAARLYWHIDGEYRTQTSEFHRYATPLSPGSHLLEVHDAHGNRMRRALRIK